MKTTTFITSLGALLLSVLPALAQADAPSAAPAAASSKLLDGLSKSDWSSIREAYDTGRHSFQPTEHGG